ncbi:MAG: sigma-70 family RNA polymerase sigma factor [Deltaproteobacteria bacterium]|nr:sigma-70 family RNA polymerase sigma factor [Deltaproteobacteria bacterium]
MNRAKISEMCEKNQGLVRYFANKYLRFVPQKWHDDIISEAQFALYRSCVHFDKNKDIKFSTYAGFSISRDLQKLYNRKIKKYYSNEISMQETAYADDEGVELELGERIGYEQDFDSMDILREAKENKYLRGVMLGYTQKEIAKMDNVSQAHVSRKVRKACKELKKEFSIN